VYSCYSCHKEVSKNHFTASDGKILCEKCSEDVEPCTDRQKFLSEDIAEGYFYHYNFDLFIKLKIDKIIYEGKKIEVRFNNSSGFLEIWENTKIKKVSRPGNIIQKFQWCYSIKDSSGTILGYIGKD
jgi:hypothetical protein